MKNGFKIKIIILWLLFVCIGLSSKLYGQVTDIRGFSFGDFYPSSSGGFINIDTLGIMSSIGVVHLGGTISAAEFTIETKGKPRDISISILTPEVLLIRDNGGGYMSLSLGPISPVNYRHHGNTKKVVKVGGRLSVGNISSNPPGNYRGEFMITINNF